MHTAKVCYPEEKEKEKRIEEKRREEREEREEKKREEREEKRREEKRREEKRRKRRERGDVCPGNQVMALSEWEDKWQEGETGFHKSDVHK